MTKKFEPVTFYAITRSADAFDDSTETLTFYNSTIAKVYVVKNPLLLKERNRDNSNYAKFEVRYTPANFAVAQFQEGYSVLWRDKQWRIIEMAELDRDSIIFTGFYVNSGIAV